jgi:hypothetical protein
MRFLLLLFSLALTCGIRAGTIVPDNATTTLWPDGAPFSFFDFASTGGGTDFNATTADFIRSFGAPDVGTEGTRVTIRGLAWATSGTLADVPATSATVTITYLGGDGVPGGGDDVLAGSVTNAFSYSGTPSEMVWIFDEPLVLDNDGLNSMYRIRVAANGNIRYKTYSGTSGADNVKLSVAGSSEALGEVQERLFPHKSMFVAGGLFNEQVAALRNSGFDTAILWSVHVNTSGVLSLNNDTLIDASGNYVYGQWARTNCALLKQPPTTISRIEFSVGSYGATDFEAIEFLVNKSPSTGGGTGAGSILRRNFQALRDNFPQVDAINFDDESNYDVASTTAFAIMLADLGYKITFCPYTRRTTFWGPLYGAIEAARPGAVDHIYLQCYDGGVFNNPASWNGSFGSLKVEPGLWAGLATENKRSDPSEVETAMNAWRESADIPGGFIWRLDYAVEGGHTVRDYAAAINGTYSAAFDATKHYKILSHHSGMALMVRDETIAGAPALATANGAEIAQGIYEGDNPRFHWLIEDVGDGFRKITNRHSGKSMAVFATAIDGVTPLDRSTNGAEIAQWEYLGDEWYQWRVTDIGSGYKFINRFSGKTAAVFGANTAGATWDRAADGADVGQWEYLGSPWFHWDIIETQPLKLTDLSLSGGQVHILVHGEPTSSIILQSSPSLAPGSWVDEQTLLLDATGRATFSRTLPEGPSRFYRGVAMLDPN